MNNDDDREQAPPSDGEVVIPVIEEDVVPGVESVKTGGVRVVKHVEKRIRRIDTPLLHEDVEVRRVAVNRVVTEAPQVRKQGDTLIVPVVEEEIVVTKRLVLKEEIHLIKHRTTDRFQKTVELDRESAEVRRLDPSGRVLDTPRPAATAKPAARLPRRRSILGKG